MKVLIILMLIIACGKYEEPKPLDLRDSDGDQIRDYLEGDFNKYLADFEALKVIHGVIKYSSIPNHEISFSNQTDLKEDTIKLMTGEMQTMQRDQYFSEWSELKLKLPTELIESHNQLNILHVYFGPTETNPDELVLIEGQSTKPMGQWSDYMRLQLTKDEFNSLMRGKSKLGLRRKFKQERFFLSTSDQSIKSQTYKVHLYDGKRSKIYYVSRNLTVEQFLRYLKIEKVIKVTDEFLFFNSLDQSSKQWFQKEYEDSNIAIAHISIQDLKKDFYKKFHRQSLTLKRDNGVSMNSLILENKDNKRIFLKVRPIIMTSRSFSEYSEVSRHQIGSPRHGTDESWTCLNYMKKIETENVKLPTLEDFFDNLKMPFNLDTQMAFLEQFDERGVFWEIMIVSPPLHWQLTLSELNPSSYTKTGQIAIDCGYKGGYRSTAATLTNPEGQLKFEVESFVEKID